MDVNELKNLCKSVKSPDVSSQAMQGVAATTGSLIDRLKAQESAEAQRLKKARPLWLIAAACFLLMFVGMLCSPPAGLGPSRLLFGGVLAAVYLLIVALVGNRLKYLTRIDYAAPLRVFLDEAQQRHRFMGFREFCLTSVALIVLGVASGLYVDDSLIRRFIPPEYHAFGIVFFCLGFLLLCAAGFGFTYRNWKRDKAPLLADIQKMKMELMVNETDEPAQEPSSRISESQS